MGLQISSAIGWVLRLQNNHPYPSLKRRGFAPSLFLILTFKKLDLIPSFLRRGRGGYFVTLAGRGLQPRPHVHYCLLRVCFYGFRNGVINRYSRNFLRKSFQYSKRFFKSLSNPLSFGS